MMAETFERDVFGGGAKPTQIRVTLRRLSTTFLLEIPGVNSSFFVEDRETGSKNVCGKCHDHFQISSGTSYAPFQLFSTLRMVAA